MTSPVADLAGESFHAAAGASWIRSKQALVRSAAEELRDLEDVPVRILAPRALSTAFVSGDAVDSLQSRKVVLLEDDPAIPKLRDGSLDVLDFKPHAGGLCRPGELRLVDQEPCPAAGLVADSTGGRFVGDREASVVDVEARPSVRSSVTPAMITPCISCVVLPALGSGPMNLGEHGIFVDGGPDELSAEVPMASSNADQFACAPDGPLRSSVTKPRLLAEVISSSIASRSCAFCAALNCSITARGSATRGGDTRSSSICAIRCVTTV